MIEFYNKYKKIIYSILGLLVLTSIIVIIVISLNKNPNDNPTVDINQIIENRIVLFGDEKIQLKVGDKYVEPGYYAVSKEGKIDTSKVKVESDVDTSKEGTYTITYIYEDKEISRTIEVIKEEEVPVKPNITFKLKGDLKIEINQGESFTDPGYLAYDDNSNDYTNKVVVRGIVDVNTPGTYTILYTLQEDDGNILELEREVEVKSTYLDATITLSTTEYTKEDISATIKVEGDNFSYIRFPDNIISENKTSTYRISKNGTYTIYIYDKNYQYITKQINVKNIDKEEPTGTCNANFDKGNTTIKITASDSISGIKNYEFYGDGKLIYNGNLSSYAVTNKLKEAYVNVYDKAGNSKKISCNIETSYDLEVHFINVGREDAIVIRDSTKTIFIDGGSYSKRNKITTYLKNLGVTHVDALIGSHLHYNHIQAQAAILKNFTVDKIYYPQDLNTCYSTYCDKADQKYILSEIKKQKKDITIMKVGDSIDIGDMNIYCIGPIKFQKRSQNIYRQNFNSLNFILTYGDTKFMFTGDHVQSSNILKKFDSSILDIDVFKYPHHGNDSLGKKFVNAITPKYVVVTNTKDELASRSEKSYLKNAGASIYYSYKHGNILVTSDGKSVSIKTNVKAVDYKR